MLIIFSLKSIYLSYTDFHWDLDTYVAEMLLNNKPKRATDKIICIFNTESYTFLLLKYKMQ